MYLKYHRMPYNLKIENVKMQWLNYAFLHIRFLLKQDDIELLKGQTKCTLCNFNDLKDEYYFTLFCTVYCELRKLYIQKYF